MMTVTSLPACAASVERADDGGIAAGAVQGLLDGQHVRIARRLFDEVGDRPEALKRVLQEHVAGAQGGE